MEEPKRNNTKSFLARCTEPIQAIGAEIERVRTRLIKIPVFNFLYRIINGMGNDGALEIAGAIAYYAVLSFFPLLLGVISVLGFLLPSAINAQDSMYQFVEDNLPFLENLLSDNIDAIIKARGALGVISIIALFFSAGAMFSAISRGVNRAWGLNIRHHLIVRKLREIAMAVSACVFFFVIIISSSVLVSFNPGNALGGFGIHVLAFLLVFLVFLVIYKTMPGIKTYWRNVWTGALFAAVAFEVARIVMIFYLSNSSRIELIYDVVGSFIIMLMFIYYVSIILIIGAEISSEYSRLRQGLPPRRGAPPDIYQH